MKLKLLILLTLTTIFAVACNQQATSNSTTTTSTEKKKIGVTLLTREDDFYRELEAGLKETAEKSGFELLVQSGDKDLSKQQSQIDNFIVQKVAAIIVCPTDTKGIAPAIERANAANIPVFTADIAAGGGKIVSHVASNNVEGGKIAAEFISNMLKDGGKVGIIGQPEVQSTIDREKGFRNELAKNTKITIVPTLNGEGKRDRALKAAEDLLQGNADIKAIFCINDETALGTLSAIDTKGKKDVIIVGYDAAPEAVAKIKAGTALKASVAQQPRDIGAKTIEAIAKHLKGEKVEPTTNVAVKIVDK